MVTGAAIGFWTANDVLLTLEECKAATEETHRLRRRVTANACGAQGIKNAVLAGVDCIEHGTHIAEDEEVLKMIVDRRIGWVPAFYVYEIQTSRAREAKARGEKIGLPDYWIQRVSEEYEVLIRNFQRAMEAGVLAGMGTDSGAPYLLHGKNAQEMELYVRFGLSEMDAIVAATRSAAEILGMEDTLGTVEAGKEADVIVVTKDPLKDIKVLQDNENVALVIKGGKIVVDRRGQPAGKWVE